MDGGGVRGRWGWGGEGVDRVGGRVVGGGEEYVWCEGWSMGWCVEKWCGMFFCLKCEV